MTRSNLTTSAWIISAIMGLLMLDDLISAGLGRWGGLSGGQIAWRLAPLVVGGIALAVIATRIRRSR